MANLERQAPSSNLNYKLFPDAVVPIARRKGSITTRKNRDSNIDDCEAPERKATILVKGGYNYFAETGTFSAGQTILSFLRQEKTPQHELLIMTDKTRVSKRLLMEGAFLNKMPVLIVHDEIDIEDLPSGERASTAKIISIKPVPKDCIFAYEPEDLDPVEMAL